MWRRYREYFDFDVLSKWCIAYEVYYEDFSSKIFWKLKGDISISVGKFSLTLPKNCRRYALVFRKFCPSPAKRFFWKKLTEEWVDHEKKSG